MTEHLSTSGPACFFCNPDRSRILFETDHFYVLLGLGPIIEGYLILVTREHVRSTLDLSPALMAQYAKLKQQVRTLVRSVYGEAVLAEHGRINACTFYDHGHESHCYHAHQLLFPCRVDIVPALTQFGFDMVEYASLEQAQAEMDPEREYLLFEDTGGRLHVGSVAYKCPRQFLRNLVAEALGVPERTSWREYEGWDEIERAKQRYLALLERTEHT